MSLRKILNRLTPEQIEKLEQKSAADAKNKNIPGHPLFHAPQILLLVTHRAGKLVEKVNSELKLSLAHVTNIDEVDAIVSKALKDLEVYKEDKEEKLKMEKADLSELRKYYEKIFKDEEAVKKNDPTGEIFENTMKMLGVFGDKIGILQKQIALVEEYIPQFNKFDLQLKALKKQSEALNTLKYSVFRDHPPHSPNYSPCISPASFSMGSLIHSMSAANLSAKKNSPTTSPVAEAVTPLSPKTP